MIPLSLRLCWSLVFHCVLAGASGAAMVLHSVGVRNGILVRQPPVLGDIPKPVWLRPSHSLLDDPPDCVEWPPIPFRLVGGSLGWKPGHGPSLPRLLMSLRSLGRPRPQTPSWAGSQLIPYAKDVPICAMEMRNWCFSSPSHFIISIRCALS